MEDDYYATLGISKSANTDEIKSAYKKLALRYHPDKNSAPKAGEKFRLIAEAYRMVFKSKQEPVISNDCRYSENRAKTRAQEQWNDIFAKFFDTPNNCKFSANDLCDSERLFSDKKLPKNNMFVKTEHNKQVIPKEQYLYLTLAEVLNGCTKKISITSKLFSHNGKICRKEQKDFTVDVKPGIKTGTKIVIKTEECNQKLSAITGDIVFVVRDSAHELFTRKGDDIVYNAKISLKQALIGCQLNIPTLTGVSTIKYDVNAIVSPETIIRLPALGLPHFKAPHKRGDILVQFEIMFPDVVSGDVKRVLRDNMP